MKWSNVMLAGFLAILVMQPEGAIAQGEASPGMAEEKKEEEKPFILPPVKVTAPYAQPAVPERATTATKTDTPLKDIPASIQVVPKEVLADQGAYSLDGVLKNVSGMATAGGTNYGFFNRYTIRGLNQEFLRDGFSDGPQVNGYARTLTDVERVEVLKGPGSALYGSGAPGGTVNLISKQPLEESLYSFYASGGSFGTHREVGDLTGPITGGWLYRFIGAQYHTNGFRKQANTTTEILPMLTWRPNPWHQLTLDFDYRNIRVVPDPYGIQFRGGSILDVPRHTKYSTPFDHVDQEVFRGALHYEWRFSDNFMVRNNFTLLQRDLFLLRNSFGSIAAGSTAMTGRRLRRQTDDARDYQYQLEPVWSVRTGSIKHELLLGFEYLNQFNAFKRVEANLPNIDDVFHPVIRDTKQGLVFNIRSFDGHIQAKQFGLYAQDFIEFSDQWKARLGLRWNEFDTGDLNRDATPSRRSRSDDKTGGQAGLVYQPVPATSFYAGASRGHLTNFTSESSGAARPPETATQWEVGNKTTFLDGRISLNLAFFHVTRENFLVNISGQQVPVGEQRTRGIELDLASEPLPGWKLYGNYAFHDAELVKLAPADRANEGNRPTGVPRPSAAFWTTYEFQDGLVRGFGFGGGVTFKGKTFQNNENTNRIPSYTVGDLVAFYRRGPYQIQLNLNNVADTTYFRGGANSGAQPGEPFSVLATLQFRY